MVVNSNANIVVVDDEKYICSIIVEALASDNYNINYFTDPIAAQEYIEKNSVDLVLTDLVMGDHSGVDVIERTMACHRDAVVILMTAHPTVQTAISVLKKGAYDFLVKPFKLDLLKATIRRGLEHQSVLRDNMHLKGQVEFLKVASASVAGVNIDKFLDLTVKSCKKEMAAQAVGVLEVDPRTRDVIRTAHKADADEYVEEVLDESTLLNFSYTRSNRPNIQRSQITNDGETVTRIFLSQPIFASRKLHGVFNILIISPFDEITSGQLNVLSILSNSAASAITNHRLYQDLELSYLQAIKGLANAIEARDPYTAGHTDRVSHLARKIAQALEWDDARVSDLMMGCTLHDIGKIGVPDRILNKAGTLTGDERRMMNSHPQVGLKIISGIDLFRPAVPYIIAHHEWFNGDGYPEGISGEGIPIEGRLLAVADTFDAILSDRPYRRGAGLGVAVSELIKYRGAQFDPLIVDTFIEILRQGKIDLEEMYGREEDLSVIDGLLNAKTVSA